MKTKILAFVKKALFLSPVFVRLCFYHLLLNRFNGSGIRLCKNIRCYLFKSKIHVGKDNYLKIGDESFIKSLTVTVTGTGNRIIIGDRARFVGHCTITIEGNNNSVLIAEDVFVDKGTSVLIRGNNCSICMSNGDILLGCSLSCRDNGSEIHIGERADIGKNTHFVSMEGKNITVGDDCMFSYNCEIRNTDSHSVLNSDGERVNSARDVIIGDHCWLAQGSLLLKGSTLPNGTICGANSLVNKQFMTENSVIAGSPARLISEDRFWSKECV